METEIFTKPCVGYRVKLKKQYTNYYSDWREHNNCIGTIYHILKPGEDDRNFTFRVSWEDGTSSSGSEKYFHIFSGEWDV